MAAPTYYPLWATEDTTLPATDNTNKERPKDSLQTTGWDKGQIPSAEEMNWMLNNIYLWIQYLNDEALPKYLPITGTTITLSGEVTGTASFAGTNTLAIASTVTTSLTGTANSIARRTSIGALVGATLYSRPLTTSGEATVVLQNSSSQNVGVFSGTQGDSGYCYIRRFTPSTQATPTIVQLFDAGYVNITNPRTETSQETAGNALVRYDTLSSSISTLNSSISSVSSALSSYESAAAATFVSSVRLGTRVGQNVGGSLVEYGTGYVVTAGGDFGADDGYYYLRPLQYQINGNWYTAAYV